MNKNKFLSVFYSFALLFIFLPLNLTQIFLDRIPESSTESTIFFPIVEKHVVGWSNMVYIPEGYSWYGCDPDHNGGFPCNEYYFDRYYISAFFIDKTEVTNAQYARCVDAGICFLPHDFSSKTRKNYYNNPTFSDYPVVHVTMSDAINYCVWAGKGPMHLNQWQKAARGPDERRSYPWGDEDPNCTLANSFNNSTSKDCIGDTAKVGSYPAGASPYGVLDMSGNVAEIVNGTSYYISYYINGSFESDWSKLTLGSITGWDQQPGNADHLPTVGFRCMYNERHLLVNPD